MTAPTLPETLARLAQLLPERVRMENDDRIMARWGIEPDRPGDDFSGQPRWRYLWGRWSAGWVPFREMSEQWLEAALREECEGRGWPAALTLNPPGTGRPCSATIWSGGWHSGGTPSGPLHFGKADTPAHALALAMISVLGGEGA